MGVKTRFKPLEIADEAATSRAQRFPLPPNAASMLTAIAPGAGQSGFTRRDQAEHTDPSREIRSWMTCQNSIEGSAPHGWDAARRPRRLSEGHTKRDVPCGTDSLDNLHPSPDIYQPPPIFHQRHVPFLAVYLILRILIGTWRFVSPCESWTLTFKSEIHLPVPLASIQKPMRADLTCLISPIRRPCAHKLRT